MKALAWAPIAHRRLPKVAAAAPSIAWAPCTSTVTADDVAQRLSTPDAAYATARETARGVVDVLCLADVLSGVAVAASWRKMHSTEGCLDRPHHVIEFRSMRRTVSTLLRFSINANFVSRARGAGT